MYFDELALKGPFGANIQHSEGYVTLKFVGKRNILSDVNPSTNSD